MTTTTLRIGQDVTVLGERAIVRDISDSHDWVLCEFPDRERWVTGWVDPKNIKT